MKKSGSFLIGIGIGVMLLTSVTAGYERELPYSGSVEIRAFGDQFTLDKVVPVLVKKGPTYEEELGAVQIRIAPHGCRIYSENREYEEDKTSFHKVLVYVALLDAEEDISKDFRSYLNYEECTGSDERGRLFWDHAGEERADGAGKEFTAENPVEVEDDCFRVTITLVDFHKSPYPYMPGDDFYCDSDSECLVYLNFLAVRVTADYAQAQKDVRELLAEAGAHEETAFTSFQEDFLSMDVEDFRHIKEEYEKAETIYAEIGDTERYDNIRDMIEDCESYITAFDNLSEGRNMYKEAAKIENYREAIEKYEEARFHFEKAKSVFDDLGFTEGATVCQSLIDDCDDEIENLENVGRLRVRLLYILVVIVVVAVAGGMMTQLKKSKAPHPVEGLSLRVRSTETGEEITIHVDPLDKIGRVRQIAGTDLGVIPSEMLHHGEVCPPDRTVAECSLTDGDVVTLVSTTRAAEPEQKSGPTEMLGPGHPQIIFGNEVFEITEDSVTMGRWEKADIHIPESKKFVSRVHARIYREHNEYWIQDNNSANGTFVLRDGDYKKIEKEVLHNGDVIVLAHDPEGEKEVQLTFKSALEVPGETEMRGPQPDSSEDAKDTVTGETEMTKQASLVVENTKILVDKDIVTIGRDEKADVRIQDPKKMVSRIHARIYKEKGEYIIEDNESVNGTFILRDGDYKQVKKEVLHNGDSIALSYDPSRGPYKTLMFVIQ